MFEIPKTKVNTIDKKETSEIFIGVQSVGKDDGENIDDETRYEESEGPQEVFLPIKSSAL